MALTVGKCPICGKNERLVMSNNPLVAPVGISCVESKLDLKNLEHADFFCRTFNLPFHPTMWIKAIEKDEKNIIENYTQYFLEINKDNLHYTTTTKDIWKEANKEWEKALTHAELLDNIKPIKEDFMRRSRMTWGANFSFEELIKMESQFQNTISSFDVNNPMQMDAIRKAAITSVMIDRSMMQGDVKDLKDLSAAYAQFMKMAKIDELIESAQTDVIRTVADLANYLEEQGFNFKFYDNVERDIVDKTIDDLKEYLRTLVLESTGLEATLELIAKKYQEKTDSKIEEEVLSKLPLDEITRIAKQEMHQEIDEELASEDIIGEAEIPQGDDGYDSEDF